MRALITGASGFIGFHLGQVLIGQGHDVTGCVRATSNTRLWDELDARTVHADIHDVAGLQTAFKGADVVFNLAGVTSSPHPQDFQRVNVDGARNVVSACVHSDVPTLIHVSSLAAAGPCRNHGCRQEQDPPSPVSLYGQSKLDGERALVPFADQVAISIMRPPIVLGEGDMVSVQLFRCIEMLHIHAVPGYQRRRFSIIHAADLAHALAELSVRGERIMSNSDSNSTHSNSTHSKAAETGGHGIYYADVDWHPYYHELGLLIAQALETWCIPLPVPKFFVASLGAVSDIVGRVTGKSMFLGIDKSREATAPGDWLCNSSKVRSQLGLKPQSSLEDRLRSTADWYKVRGWL